MRYLHFESLRGDLQEGCFSLPNAGFGLFEHKIGVFVRLTLRGACAIVDCSRDDPAEDAPTWVAAGDTRQRYATARNNRRHTAESTPPHVTTVETPPHITTVGTPS